MKPIQTKNRAKTISRLALSVAFLTISSWITIPIGPIPVTLQTLAIALCGALLKREGVIAVLIYLLTGLLAPVFSSFRAGPAALFGPTGGYLFGFVFLALFSALSYRFPFKKKPLRFFAALFWMSFGELFCYAFGTLWFMLLTKATFSYALSVAVLPFLLPDLIKFAIAALIGLKAEKRI